VPDDITKVLRHMLDPDPSQRPLPHQVAESLQPALERQPRAKLSWILRG
jgi:eukaryotic-like serine/threonine-protein kinase